MILQCKYQYSSSSSNTLIVELNYHRSNNDLKESIHLGTAPAAPAPVLRGTPKDATLHFEHMEEAAFKAEKGLRIAG